MPSEPGVAPRTARHPLRATYRLQLHSEFGFDAARAIVPYLSELGVSHAYLSPCLTATRGSTHGYDVADATRENAELGGESAHASLTAALAERHLGQLIDIVPNHMSSSVVENRWWRDVLEHGTKSRYATYFDVDWGGARDGGRVVLPVLGEPLEAAFASGAIRLEEADGTIVLQVNDVPFPLSARCVAYLRNARRDRESLRALLDRYNADWSLARRVIDVQAYDLRPWREGAPHRNYRRFFDVDSLIGLRVEQEEVFHDSHVVIARWLREGVVDGVRIDHVDGLKDPKGYLERVRALAPEAHVFVEKILGEGERVPGGWSIAGTTGYEYLNLLEGLFIDPAGERPIVDFCGRFTGQTQPFVELARDAKREVMGASLGSDVSRLVKYLSLECKKHESTKGTEESALRAVVTEYMALLPVYRTYVAPGPVAVRTDADLAMIRATLAEVSRRLPETDLALVDFVARVLTAVSEPASDFTLLLQQTSGAVMAKGVEDTAFYRHVPLLSLNEVGGDPAHFGTSLAAFHARNQENAANYPEALLSTATHDTKRGEDTRARLDVLSEIPTEWERAVTAWSKTTAGYRDAKVDPNDEYAFYQTVLAAFPLSEERAVQWFTKAMREEKRRTSWTDVDEAYEKAALEFARRALGDPAFTGAVRAFLDVIEDPARVVSLAKKLIALTSPGVPDVYQGTELWDYSLVDPDNRRPVDYHVRQRLLARVTGEGPEASWKDRASGAPKLRVVQASLAARRRFPRAFAAGSPYTPLRASGPAEEHVVAYARGDDVVVVAPRLVMKLQGGWRDTAVELPGGDFVNALTGDAVKGGRIVKLEELLRRFPVALLTRPS